jgi:hypothetical protein
VQNEEIVSYGEPRFVPEGTYNSLELEMSVSYLDDVHPSMSRLVIYASENLEDVGEVSDRTIAAEVRMVPVEAYGDTCLNCCTFPRDGTPFKASAIMIASDLEGVRALIDTKYGRLCGEGTALADSVSAHQACFVGMMETVAGYGNQVQMGWINIRNYDIGRIDSGVYWEMTFSSGASLLFFGDSIPKPAQGSYHNYEVRRPSPDVIRFSYGGAIRAEYDVPGWANVTMQYPSWQGEIRGRETNMPGDSLDPCYFRSLAIRQNGSWNPVYLSNDGITDELAVTRRPGIPAEWGVDHAGNELWIWDNHPL